MTTCGIGETGGMTPSSADADARHELDVLLLQVRSELAVAGLPVIPEDHPVGTAGALVMVDMPDLSGVLVHWRTHAVLSDAGQEALGDDPLGQGAEARAFRDLNTVIGEAMQQAIRTILSAAGFEVTATGNDYAPFELLVTQRLALSPWQQRRDRRSTDRMDTMRAAWTKHHQDEHAASTNDSNSPPDAASTPADQP